MPSIKAVTRKDVLRSDNTANIKIRVSHAGKVRYIGTKWYIDPKYMNSDGLIKNTYAGQSQLNGAILQLMQQYNNIIADIGSDVVYLPINSLISKLKGQTSHGSSFTAYMKHRTEELIKEGRHGYAMSYQVTLNHLDAFHADEIAFKEITVSLLNDFKGHLRKVNGCKVNTIRIYLNNIRAVFYHAIDNDIVKGDFSPFRKFKIEQEKTAKRSLDIADLKKLLKCREKVTKQQQRAIDIFFLIFYLLGINLKDLLYLRSDSLHKGRIFYRRFKTGREYSIKVYPEAQSIITRYRGKKYLLNYMDEKEKVSAGRMEEADHDVLSQMNKLLKTVVKSQKLKFKVTTYTARHSWATIASKLNIEKDVIAHALGHGIDSMTDIYIDFDLAKVDRANRKVISKLKS
jgi:integrase